MTWKVTYLLDFIYIILYIHIYWTLSISICIFFLTYEGNVLIAEIMYKYPHDISRELHFLLSIWICDSREKIGEDHIFPFWNEQVLTLWISFVIIYHKTAKNLLNFNVIVTCRNFALFFIIHTIEAFKILLFYFQVFCETVSSSQVSHQHRDISECCSREPLLWLLSLSFSLHRAFLVFLLHGKIKHWYYVS